jgi:hypothetical protein
MILDDITDQVVPLDDVAALLLTLATASAIEPGAAADLAQADNAVGWARRCRGHQDRRPVPFGTKISCRTGPSARPDAATLAAVPSGAGRGAWREHDETSRRRAVLPEVTGRWRQLQRFVDLYLPSDNAYPVWILWMEAWARTPHDAEVSRFLDELMLPWYDDLAEIVQRGVHEGTFGLQVPFRGLHDLLLRAARRARDDPAEPETLPDLSRARLIELAMATARAQLAPVTPHGSRHA